VLHILQIPEEMRRSLDKLPGLSILRSIAWSNDAGTNEQPTLGQMMPVCLYEWKKKSSLSGSDTCNTTAGKPRFEDWFSLSFTSGRK